MNIADKQQLYSEVARVLKPGGRFVFQEVAAGNTAACYFPLPWATEPADSTLVTADDMCAILGSCGFVDDVFEDVSNAQFSTNVTNSTPSSQGQLSLTVFVDNLGEKAGNARRSLEEGQIRYVRGVFRVN